MSEKLTIRIAMMYPNACVNYKGDLNKFEKLKALSVRSYNTADNSLTCIYLSPSGEETLKVSDCKLILRHLSKLTENEEKELLSIVRLFDTYKQIASNYYYVVLLSYSQQRIFDKLREWNIDFESPSLFERGIAVYE